MHIVVRPAEPHELRDAANAMRIPLLFPRTDDDGWERWKAGWESGHLAITAWDGDQCVGHAGSFEFDTLVPGGAWVPTSGVTRVGVFPTHTRRGLLSRMIRELLDRHRADGRLLASLRASESVIYQRFGFGLAGEATAVLLHPRRALPVKGAAPGSFRLLADDELRTVLPGIYDRATHRPGAITRSAFMWDRVLLEAVERGKAGSAVVHSSPDGVDDGFAIYDVQWEDRSFEENLGTGTLHHLSATSPAVELALWDYLLRISLMRTFTAENRPVDDLLRLAVADPRAYEVKQRWDEQWVRLLHVEAALAARTYGDGDAVTITVDDPWYADNCGTFRVAADGVRRVEGEGEGEGELHVSINEISATYFGGIAWRDLLAVGRIQGSADAARRADTLFAHQPTTWSGTFF